MKPISQYKNSELLDLHNDTFSDAVRAEALSRGIDVPISVPENLRVSEWTGYNKPAEAQKVFRVKAGYHISDFAWLSEEAAMRGLEGMVHIEDQSWENKKFIRTDTPHLVIDWVGHFPNSSKMEKFERGQEDTKRFDGFLEKCIHLVTALKSSTWRIEMLREKKAEYLRLASGDISVAKAFWNHAMGQDWPGDDLSVDSLSINWETLTINE